MTAPIDPSLVKPGYGVRLILRTHALLATSPANDAGNNLQALVIDARGAGFDRMAGAGADIGAYERQINDDELFYSGFD